MQKINVNLIPGRSEFIRQLFEGNFPLAISDGVKRENLKIDNKGEDYQLNKNGNGVREEFKSHLDDAKNRQYVKQKTNTN